MSITVLDANGVKRDVPTLDDLIESYPPASPVFLADPSGAAIDEDFAVVGVGAAANDILAQIDCRSARAVLFHFPARGSSQAATAQGSFDGANWRNLTVHSLTAAASPINGAFLIDATLRAVETQGFPTIRIILSSAGNGMPVSVARRRISENLPWITTAMKPTVTRVLPTTDTTAAFATSTRSGYTKSWRMRNISDGDKWFHVAAYNISATPFSPALIIDSQLLKAGEAISVDYPGAGLPSASGFAFAVTTDAAATAFAATGSIVGSIVQVA